MKCRDTWTRSSSRVLGFLGATALVSVFLLSFAYKANAANLCVGGTPNGLVTGSEECDDGGASNSDACTDDCTWARCGDGYICTDATNTLTDCSNSPYLTGIEECDVVGGADSSTCNGTAAGAALQCKTSSCGDSYVNAAAGETCDVLGGADTATCDGSSAPLANRCTARVCGDGYENTYGDGNPLLDVEECDDGQTNNNGACVNIGGKCRDAECGDGQVYNTGGGTEDCDNGTTADSADCDYDCSDVVCGDGYVNDVAEDCDDGSAADYVVSPGVACNGSAAGAALECRYSACPDGYTNASAGETCDDGNANNNDPCPGNCQDATCGDGFQCSAATCDTSPKPYSGPEICDDGNLINTDSCTTSCLQATCGDGSVQAGEDCDDGQAYCDNTGSYAPDHGEPCSRASGCRGVCVAGPQIGAPCMDETVKVDCDLAAGTAADCDDNGIDRCVVGGDNRDDIDGACRSSCQAAYCGDGNVDGSLGEVCDDGNANNTDACIITDMGGEYSDGVAPNPPKNCEENDCGDGFPCTSTATCTGGANPDLEDCDDGNTSNGDACLNTCVDADCGDNYTWAGEEECDQGVNNDDNVNGACREDCTYPRCGDGQIDGNYLGDLDNPEECDDGASNSDHGTCTSECKTAACGDGLTCDRDDCTTGPLGDPEECDDGNAFCVTGTAPIGTPCDNVGTIDPDACGPDEDTVFGLCTSDGDGCTGPGSITGLQCANEGCGDGNRNLAEILPGRCEDGNNVEGDGCDAECYDEICGNGRTGYNCLAGFAVWGTPLSNPLSDEDCTSLATTTEEEECDDANTNDLDACANDCVAAVCGDGITNGSEECDDGVTIGDAGNQNYCLNDCTFASCGDNFVCLAGDCNDDHGEDYNGHVEDCDESSGADTADCNGADGDADGAELGCMTPTCGDGYVNTAALTADGNTELEECDDGGSNGAGPDECHDCIAPTCGDDQVDPGLGEQCDDLATALPTVDCNPNCCNTGNDSYIDSFAGYTCQDAILDQCSTSQCGKGKKIDKLNVKAGKLVAKADALKDVNKMPQASRKARGAGKKLAKAAVLASDSCTPAALACLTPELHNTREIVLELEANLLGNNP